MLKINATGAEKILVTISKVQETPPKLIDIWGLQTERDAKTDCPVKTGRLRNSIKYKRVGKFIGEVGSNLTYAAVVDLGGRRYYAIFPRNKKCLAWKGAGGEWVFTLYVLEHPPMVARPYLYENAKKNFEKIIGGG